MATATGSTPGLIRTFLLDHERLIIVGILGIGLWFGYGKYADIRAAHDNAILAQAKLTTDAQVKANQQLTAQVQADQAALQQLQTKLEAQNAALVSANTQLATALTQRQHTDAALPLPDLAVRWNQLVPTAIITAVPAGLAVDPAGAHATVAALEQVDPLKQELTNVTTEKQNDDLLLTQANKNIFDLNAQVQGATKLDTDHQAQCVDQIKVVKAEAAKSKRRWFVIGYIAGFLSRQFITK
jgi:multidrug efflux pump subunit AcrA (membrane-fusion protein)